MSVTRNAWGWSYGYGSRIAAAKRALRECEVRGVKCLLYATDDRIVWDTARARAEAARIVSSRALRGAVWRYYGERNPHGVEVILPRRAPSIISDYHSVRGVLGNFRSGCPVCRPRHQAIDIIGAVGTPVLAAADGIVAEVDFEEVAGNRILVMHVDPKREKGKWVAVNYIHLDRSLVRKGDRVVRGQQIGTIGVTGTGTTPEAPHLHFETLHQNPHLFWHDGPGKVTCFDPSRHYSPSQFALTYPVPCRPLQNGLS